GGLGRPGLLFSWIETAADEERHEVFLQSHVVVRVEERDLGLDHPEFSKVSARLRFLGAECWAEGVDSPQRSGCSLPVQLAGLGEIRGALLEVFGREKATALADRGSEDRGIDPDEPALVEEVVDRLLHLVA